MEKDKQLEGLRFLESNRTFLGREFLTWLWYTAETNKHDFNIEGVGKVQIYIDDKLVLSSTSGSVHEACLKGGTPAYAKEARTALLSGKLVQEAKFIMHYNDQEWSWTMKGTDLIPRGLRVPTVSEADATSHMAKRVLYMQFLTDIIEHLFKQYMSIRLSTKFEQETNNMANWLATTQNAIS